MLASTSPGALCVPAAVFAFPLTIFLCKRETQTIEMQKEVKKMEPWLATTHPSSLRVDECASQSIAIIVLAVNSH